MGVLVVEDDGSVVPLSYGTSRAVAVCNLRQQRLSDAWPDYEQTRYLSFRSLCRDVWRESPRRRALCHSSTGMS
jgi:hypothetical protein